MIGLGIMLRNFEKYLKFLKSNLFQKRNVRKFSKIYSIDLEVNCHGLKAVCSCPDEGFNSGMSKHVYAGVFLTRQ